MRWRRRSGGDAGVEERKREEWVVAERWAEARRRARSNLGIFGVGHRGLPGDGREGGSDVEEEVQALVRDAVEEEGRGGGAP